MNLFSEKATPVIRTRGFSNCVDRGRASWSDHEATAAADACCMVRIAGAMAR